MRSINLSKQADHFLSQLDSKQFKQIVKSIFDLGKNLESGDIKKMHNNGNISYYCKDVGEYRVIYHSTENVLYVTVIGKRNDDDVYKIFDRSLK